MICRNLRSGPISAVLIFSLTAILLKLDLIQTLVNKFVLTAARFWLQCWLASKTISHKIWLAVGINGSWKHLFLAWLFSWMISRRRREGSIFPSFFIVLWSYSRKICLNNCPWKFRKLTDGHSLTVSQSWISLQVVDHKKGALWFTNKRVQIKILSILKLVSFESLARNDFFERCTQMEAHCERNLNCQLWSIFKKTKNMASLFKEFL